jgi:hypothetical protein
LWNTSLFFFCKKLLICNAPCTHVPSRGIRVPAKALVLSFTKLLKDTVKDSKTNKHSHKCTALLTSKKLPKQMFMVENKCFYSTAKHVKTKWKTAKTPYSIPKPCADYIHSSPNFKGKLQMQSKKLLNGPCIKHLT